MEFIFELIILYVFRYPGALFLRLFSKKTFKDYLNTDGYLIGSVGLVIVVVSVKGIVYLTNSLVS